MPAHQQKHTINNIQDKMSLLEPSYFTKADPEYSQIGEAQEKSLKTNYTKMIGVLKRKRTHHLKKSRKTETIGGNE